MRPGRLTNIETAASELWDFVLDYQSGVYNEHPPTEHEQYAIHNVIEAITAAMDEIDGISELLNV